MNQYLSQIASKQLLENIHNAGFPFVYEQQKHRIVIVDETGTELVYFRLPISIASPENVVSEEPKDVNYVMLLIQSGSCSMGYFENGINRDHKVFRSYMVRKKQGKSQIKYLKTKGKSRAGSRVRLGESLEFFENINERLQEYFEEYEIHRIAMSCSKILIPFLYNSKVKTPFDKKDDRIFKIPKHVHTPIYEVMMDVNKFLLKGELIYEVDQEGIVDELMKGVG